MSMDCAYALKFIDAYIDGEFDPADRAEMERHFSACEPCRQAARVQAQWKAALRARLARPVAPYALHVRLARGLDAETARRGSFWRRASFRFGPAAVAAAALALLIVRVQPSSPVLEESILDHQRNWPVEVVGPDPDGVASWFRGKVEFPVRPPRWQNARLLGGRIGNFGQRAAAYLIYSLPDGRKVSVIVFDAAQVPIEAPRRVIVRDRPVYLGGDRGTRVALYRDAGVGYAVASDLGEAEMVHLVGTSLGP
jgi:anti-sigma factor (TIGR02949 family)